MKSIHHVVDIDGTPSSVWAALTEPVLLASWWSTKVTSPPAAVGARVEWTFQAGFNPVMQIVRLDSDSAFEWRCVAGHDPWQDATFRFMIATLDGGRTRLRFWQDYAVELDDDAYCIYNFNWGYYLESLRLLCTTGRGNPFQPSSTW